jgi:hypothetical protein
MAGWPYESKTEVHFGARKTGTSVVADYGEDRAAAAQAATMPGAEFVQFEVTYGPCVVISDPLEGHSGQSGS